MENLTFSDNETQYYGDLFTHLDKEGSGIIPINQVHEFLRASKLPPDVLGQISQLCGGVSQGWYGRKELFVALKLVAAAQRGLPVKVDSLFLGVDLPLPRLHTNNNTQVYEGSNLTSFTPKENCTSSPDLIQLSDSDCNTSQKMVDGGYQMMESEDGDGLDERMSDPSGRMISHHSTSVSSPASDSPTPTNSIHERTWNKMQQHSHWHGLVNDEHRQLLGTEEDSSDGRSSGEECNVWSITDEQRQYYTEQFKAMQPDLTALLAGSVAKEFFEKSKLPVNELSKIWQLSDVTRDGCLSLDEFFTAMHLVVLRRNNIELPETLPPSLYPDGMAERKSSSSGVEGGNSGGSATSPAGTGGAECEAGATKATPDPLSPSRSKEWTKFVDSPTSTLSSPGLKPVNFDFQKAALEQDPKILHPKAVRLTPESKRLEVGEQEGPTPSFSSPDSTLTADLITTAPPTSDLQPPPSTVQQSSTQSQGSPKKSQEGQDIKPIQRPLPRKPTGGSTSGVLPPPPQPATVTTPPLDNGLFGPISLPSLPSGPLQAGKKEPPPPPPPRPARSHTRSSSLDLNKFSRNSFLGAPPAVPPRASPGATSPKKLICQRSDGDMTGMEGSGGGGDGVYPLDTRPPMERTRTSAFEVYRKPLQEFGSAFERVSGGWPRSGEEEERTRHLSTGARPKDKREIQASIRTTTEKNTILTRLNSELNQELAEVMEERIALEMQLEQMKPFSS